MNGSSAKPFVVAIAILIGVVFGLVAVIVALAAGAKPPVAIGSGITTFLFATSVASGLVGLLA